MVTAATVCPRASKDQPTEHILEPHAQRKNRLDISRRAGAKGAGDFHGGARFTAFRERDCVHSRFVSERLPRRTFGSVERRARRALSGLLPELRVANASASDELHQFQGQLVGDELVVRKTVGGR